jgi:POTRA domain-containing FtsQ-type protein
MTAADRAVRAAALERQVVISVPRGFLMWVLARVVAALLLGAAAWAVYTCASSERFQVRTVHVQGNVLLSRTDVETTAAVMGANLFWVDRRATAERVKALPLVQQVEVTPTLPETVEVFIVERQPAAFWVSGDRTYLVDREGVILKLVDAETQQARACAGQPCDPRLAPLPIVAQLDAQPLAPGDRVDANALAASARLAMLLPSFGIVPVAFEWSRDNGLQVPTREGWRARFDESLDIAQQVQSLRTVRDYLVRSKTTAELIDVRFGDRPYYR